MVTNLMQFYTENVNIILMIWVPYL